mgnify:CR=1 FL=1
MSGMNQTPAGERVHIAFFGRRNAGKSSLVNAFTGQELAIVSEVKGTTTDPVYKAMELLPVGPVQIIDTPGIDDVGELGELRIRKTRQVLNKCDLAIVVADASAPLGKAEEELIALVQAKQIPYLLVWNKADLLDTVPQGEKNVLWVSARTGLHLQELKEQAAALAMQREPAHPLVADLLSEGDTVVLVVPIDKAAPKGRLILPQQQTIRDILEAGASALVCRDTELAAVLDQMPVPPRLVITDSQVFACVNKVVPPSVPLTSFSILMARYKGALSLAVAGAAAVNRCRKRWLSYSLFPMALYCIPASRKASSLAPSSSTGLVVSAAENRRSISASSPRLTVCGCGLICSGDAARLFSRDSTCDSTAALGLPLHRRRSAFCASVICTVGLRSDRCWATSCSCSAERIAGNRSVPA